MVKSLSQSEVTAVIESAVCLRDQCMVLLSYKHGLRASEVVGLALADLRLADRQIVVRRLKGSLTNVQDLTDQSGEPLLSERRMLTRWLKERGDNASPYLFPSQKGAKLSRVQFFRIFQTAARKAGLPENRCHPHCLKHSLAIRMVEAGQTLPAIAQALGHRSVTSTMIYSRPTDAIADKARHIAFATA
jgi:type 1 fimbriae regulatory protein FimE